MEQLKPQSVIMNKLSDETIQNEFNKADRNTYTHMAVLWDKVGEFVRLFPNYDALKACVSNTATYNSDFNVLRSWDLSLPFDQPRVRTDQKYVTTPWIEMKPLIGKYKVFKSRVDSIIKAYEKLIPGAHKNCAFQRIEEDETGSTDGFLVYENDYNRVYIPVETLYDDDYMVPNLIASEYTKV